MILTLDKPLVSVIILCYNQSEIISRAIKSVLDQSYQNIQVVIVDDCSKDNSKEVIQDWLKKYPDRIKFSIQPQNVGHPRNMNTGFKLCDGELITFCDGDDWYFPEKVEREVEFLKTHPEVDVVHSNFDYYTIEGKFIKNWAINEEQIPQGDIFLQLYSLQYPQGAHLRFEMTSKKILEETGYYDEQIPVWVDWDLRLRLAQKYKFGYCHYIGSAYAENPFGITLVYKQETVLKYFQFVIEKNKGHLVNYSTKQVKSANKVNHLFSEILRLSINFRNKKHSFKDTIKFLIAYPHKIKEWRFILYSMFGMKFMKTLLAVKQKFLSL